MSVKENDYVLENTCEVEEMTKADSLPMLDKKQLQDNEETEHASVDSGRLLVYLFFFLHGIGILLPWNTILNAESYFVNYKLPNSTYLQADPVTGKSTSFMTYVGYSAQMPNVLMSSFNVFFQSSGATGGSIRTRIKLATMFEICVFICILSLALVDSNEWQDLFFVVTMITNVLLNCCGGIYQSSVFGMAAPFPMEYSNIIVLGNNFCGTLIAIVNIICKAFSTEDDKMSAVYYFSSVIIILILCFNSMFLIMRVKFFRYYINGCEAAQSEMIPELAEMSHLGEADALVKNDNKMNGSACDDEVYVEKPSRGFWSSNLSTFRNCFAVCCFRYPKSKGKCFQYWQRYIDAFRDCWVHCLSVWSIFFCTLTCYPVLQLDITPHDGTSEIVSSVWFNAIFVFLFFNLFAMVGNVVSHFVQFPPPRWLAPLVWLRTVIFILFFMFCNYVPKDRERNLPVYITSQWGFVIGQVIFAFTSGYFSSLGMMYAPRCIKNKELAGFAAMLSAFFLTFGIISGVLFAGVLNNLR